jgi:DNA-binding NarL/FixJ family response regulator
MTALTIRADGGVDVSEQKSIKRVLIADDHQLFADACKTLIESEFLVVGTVNDGRQLEDAVTRLSPDIILLDIYMPHLNGLDAGEQVKKKYPAVKLIFLTMTVETDIAAEAFRRGASGYVSKQSAGKELALAMNKVSCGGAYLSPLVDRETVTFLLNAKPRFAVEKKITRRQTEILQLLAGGMSMKQVASVIDVQPGTVAFHKYRLMETLNITTNAELVGYALKHHMIPSKSN